MGGAVAQFRVDETCAGKGCARSITALARFASLWCSWHTPCFAALRGRHIALLGLKLPKNTGLVHLSGRLCQHPMGGNCRSDLFFAEVLLCLMQIMPPAKQTEIVWFIRASLGKR